MELGGEAQSVSSMDEQRVPHNNKTLIFFCCKCAISFPLYFFLGNEIA
jgi:hypothetical protein